MRTDEQNIHIEPTMPTPPNFTLSSRDRPFIGPDRPAAADLVGPAAPAQNQGDRQREQDRKDWLEDLEHRKQRGEQLAEKRRQQATKQEVNVVAELDAALEALELGAQNFEDSFGKPNAERIESKRIVAELTARLAEEQAMLDAIEARGDSVDRLQRTVAHAESALNGLRSAAEEQALRALIKAKFGWGVSTQKIQRETIRELSLDISVQSLRPFAIQPLRQQTRDVAVLQQRLQLVGEKLAALREHLATP
jgi:hypothetical protein